MLSSSQAGLIAQVVFSTPPASNIYLFRLIPFQLQGDKLWLWALWAVPSWGFDPGLPGGCFIVFYNS